MKRLAPLLLLLVVGCAHVAPAKSNVTVDERYARLTAELERGDTNGALAETDDWLAHHNESWEPGAIANCRTWIRWMAGDKKGAFAENERLYAVAKDDPKNGPGHLKHYYWDKAYLLAEAGRLDEADAARVEFERRADKPDDADSRNTLQAWLFTMRGDGAQARAAAEKVDTQRDNDLQDLYVLSRAYAAAADSLNAERIRQLIRNGTLYAMKPVILHEMAFDAAASK